MAPVVMKLGPCDGLVRSWWRLADQRCGRPSGHQGHCRRRRLAEDEFTLQSGPHEARTTCHRCGTLVIARAYERGEAVPRLNRWLYGHLTGIPCRETVLDRRMRGVLAPTVLLDVDGTQHTFGGRAEWPVPEWP